MSELATTATTPQPAAPTAAPPSHLLPVYEELPFTPVRGEGVWLFDAAGRRVLDLWGGHAVALLGHGHPRLLAALAAQAQALLFQSNVLPLAVREEAAARLAAFAPEGLDRVFLVNTGAEANENALKIAFRRTGRTRVLALEGAFHGRTAAAGAVTWGSAKWAAFPQPPFPVTFLPRHDLAALAAALDPAAARDVAALIVEPVQGVGGAVDVGVEWLRAARELTRRAGVVLILDEVQCGMGRTGWPFGAQRAGIVPDVLTVAKGVAGGFPAGAVLATAEVTAGIGAGALGSTFGGGPLACAMIAATIDTIVEADLPTRARRLEALVRERCVVGPVTAVQGAGLLLGLRTTRPAKAIVGELLQKGILAGGAGDPHVLRILPPLTTGEEHVDLLAAALAEIAP